MNDAAPQALSAFALREAAWRAHRRRIGEACIALGIISVIAAANVDTVFVVHPIAEQPTLRRIERELSVAWDSGAMPVVALTKADLSVDPDAARAAVKAVTLGVDVLVVNALAGEGIQPLLEYISNHRTAVLIGPSGAGKSTLVNSLLGEQRQKTCEVRVGDGHGMHTTVAREHG